MTALSDYQRLETSGIWRSAEDDQRRDVAVSLGNATLVIYDGAGRALAHWSLPALLRLNPGKEPAIYSPGPDTSEELEIAEPEMITAIERIRTAIERRRPHRGRLRFFVTSALVAAMVGGAAYWVPGALIEHAAKVVPAVKRSDLGARILGHVVRLSGQPCETVAGRAALTRLHSRLEPDKPGNLVVLSSGAILTGHLPGGLVLVSRRLVEDFDTPDVVAGYVLAEQVRAALTDPIEALLTEAGPFMAARLLTTGDLPEEVLLAYAERFMTQRPPPISEQALLSAFRTARVSSQPYAYAVDISGERTLSLIEADPGGAVPVLPDSAWVSLQAICGE